MKKIYMKCLLPLFALLILSSCMKEINLEHLRPAPKLVLNGVFTAGQPVTVGLTRTWFYTEENPVIIAPDADVRLFVNDQPYERLTWYEGDTIKLKQGHFRGTYIPKTGDRLKITATAHDYPGISAETTIPEPPALLKFTGKQVTEYNGYYSQDIDKLQCTFQDDPSRDNFYLIRFELNQEVIDHRPIEEGNITSTSSWQSVYIDYSTDPLFTSSQTALDKILGYDWLSGSFGRVFSDDLIKGKAYTINISSPSYFTPFNPDYREHPEEEPEIEQHMYYRVILYTMSEAYYRYMKAVIEMQDDNTQQTLIDAGLAEPIQIYSNVAGGAGILGGCNVDSLEIQLF